MRPQVCDRPSFRNPTLPGYTVSASGSISLPVEVVAAQQLSLSRSPDAHRAREKFRLEPREAQAGQQPRIAPARVLRLAATPLWRTRTRCFDLGPTPKQCDST